MKPFVVNNIEVQPVHPKYCEQYDEPLNEDIPYTCRMFEERINTAECTCNSFKKRIGFVDDFDYFFVQRLPECIQAERAQ